MALNLNPEIALRLRKSRHRLASATPIVRRDKNSDEKPNNDRPFTSDIAEDLDQILDDSILKQNQRAIAAHLNYDHYVRELTPAAFTIDATAARVQIPAAAPQWPAINMPDAALSIVVATWRKPSEWRAGKIRIQIVYTSSVGSTNVFGLGYRVRAIRRNEVLPGTLLTADPVAISLAGPAVANTEIADVYRYTTVSFGSDDERFSLQLFRDGVADANNNPFHLLSVEVCHIPAQQESQ